MMSGLAKLLRERLPKLSRASTLGYGAFGITALEWFYKAVDFLANVDFAASRLGVVIEEGWLLLLAFWASDWDTAVLLISILYLVWLGDRELKKEDAQKPPPGATTAPGSPMVHTQHVQDRSITGGDPGLLGNQNTQMTRAAETGTGVLVGFPPGHNADGEDNHALMMITAKNENHQAVHLRVSLTELDLWIQKMRSWAARLPGPEAPSWGPRVILEADVLALGELSAPIPIFEASQDHVDCLIESVPGRRGRKRLFIKSRNFPDGTYRASLLIEADGRREPSYLYFSYYDGRLFLEEDPSTQSQTR